MIGLTFVLAILCLFLAGLMWALGLFFSRMTVLIVVGSLTLLVVLTRGLLFIDTWAFAFAAGWTLYAIDQLLVRRRFYRNLKRNAADDGEEP